MQVLGIETSCDETGVAIYDEQRGIIADALHSQTDIHQQYSGVVPELASRDHIRVTLPLIRRVMNQAGSGANTLGGIAYTAGPGLAGALLVGAAIGRSLAFARDLPAVAVHHMEAHLLAPMLEHNKPDYPFLALLVSGGHTLLVEASAYGKYRVLGESLDDAAGEAFDKTARLLGLPYPGGPAISELAQKGDAGRFRFPRPMVDRPGFDFSFSGLKTFALNTVESSDDTEQTKADIAHAFVAAVVDTLTIKSRRAIEQTGIQRLVVAGGVGANSQLRSSLRQLAKDTHSDLYFPRPEFCTDNGAMIAYAGYLKLKAGKKDALMFTARPRWPMNEIVLSGS